MTRKTKAVPIVDVTSIMCMNDNHSLCHPFADGVALKHQIKCYCSCHGKMLVDQPLPLNDTDVTQSDIHVALGTAK